MVPFWEHPISSIKLRKLAVSKRLNKKSKFLYGPVSPNFCARRSIMMLKILGTIRFQLKLRKLVFVTVNGYTKNRNFCMVPYLQIFAPGAALWFKKLNKTAVVLLAGVTKNWTKLAVVLLAGVTISGTPCLNALQSYHLVPKHLRATWPRPEQSHLLPEACLVPMAPSRDDNARDKQKRPPPETQQHS